uniref:Uncharacterized protein n=1 Tax=Bactrocera latifrons TaxID=174628 RepID=A0A0K8VL75_BACLA
MKLYAFFAVILALFALAIGECSFTGVLKTVSLRTSLFVCTSFKLQQALSPCRILNPYLVAAAAEVAVVVVASELIADQADQNTKVNVNLWGDALSTEIKKL